MNLIILYFISGCVILLVTSNNDVPITREIRKARLIKQMEDDFKRYPNMSLVLLNKCGELAPQKIAPCTLSVLDNDQNLLIEMMKSNPFILVNVVNKHLAAFPDVPLRKIKDKAQCKKPSISVNEQELDGFYNRLKNMHNNGYNR